MKVFISQPMHDIPEDIIRKEREEIFAQLLVEFIGQEIELIDNYNKPQEIVDGGRLAMLGHSIMLMKDADLVVFSPLWSSSKGCVIEHDVCESYGIRVMYWEQLFHAV